MIFALRRVIFALPRELRIIICSMKGFLTRAESRALRMTFLMESARLFFIRLFLKSITCSMSGIPRRNCIALSFGAMQLLPSNDVKTQKVRVWIYNPAKRKDYNKCAYG